MKRPLQRLRLMAASQIVFAAGIVGYWLFYFLMAQSNRSNFLISAEHAAFEAAFPAADALLTAALLTAGICLWHGKRLGGLLSPANGGAVIFLGVLDTSFNLQKGVYLHGACLGVLNAAINVLCIGFGFWLLRCTFRSFHGPESTEA